MTDISQYKSNQRTAYLAQSYEKLLSEESELHAMEKDPQMKTLVAEDLKNIEIQKGAILKQMKDIFAEEEKESRQSPTNEIILEIRAGVGGEEAALFAEELSLMYRRYAEKKGWSVNVVNESTSALGGYKEVSFEFRGKDVYDELKYETGVHRIQRIPETEKSGRVHTSTASVAILPIRKKT